jgi:hypothetical protein
METYFIRHTSMLDVDDATLQALFESRQIAIHYPWTIRNPQGSKADADSVVLQDYEPYAKKAVGALLRLSSDGGYVCAQYRSRERYLIGKVRPKSPIQLIPGMWGDRNDYSGRPAILKGLQLSTCKELDPYQYASVHIGRPQQGTISRWRNCRSLIEDLVENREIAFDLDHLTPLDQEIACQEFLRQSGTGLPILSALLGFPGRTMKDIDILGISVDGLKIMAQVTHNSLEESDWKLQALRKYNGGGDHLILFCRHNKEETIQGVHVYPINKAIESFVASPAGKDYRRIRGFSG